MGTVVEAPVKARPAAQLEAPAAFGEPSHLLALGGGRAVLLSRYRRRIGLLAGAGLREVNLAPLSAAYDPSPAADLFAHRGVPFACGAGFAVAYSDVLHLWRSFDGEPVTLPVTIGDRPARRERGRLEPVLACAHGERAAWLGLHAGAASIHSAMRIVRAEWDDREVRWLPGDLYVDLRGRAELADKSDPAVAPHPPVFWALGCENGRPLVHTTGAATNAMRYGMACSALVRLDASGRPERFDSVADGYATFGDERVLLQKLHAKPGGLDFALLDRLGAPLGDLRITKKAMAPVAASSVIAALGGQDLWLADGDGRVVRFELDAT